MRDSVKARNRRYARLCPGRQEVMPSVRAGAGIAALQCYANGVPRHVIVRLRSGQVLPIALPGNAAVSVIGRYWIGSQFVRPEVYVSRSTGEVRRNVDALIPPVLNPDSPSLSRLPTRPGVARLLYSGEPLTSALPPGMVIRDPRIHRDVRIVRDCDSFCGPPFGRVGRLTYVQGHRGRQYVRLLVRGKRVRTWAAPHPVSELDETSTVVAKLTSREIVVSVIRADGAYDIKTARA